MVMIIFRKRVEIHIVWSEDTTLEDFRVDLAKIDNITPYIGGKVNTDVRVVNPPTEVFITVTRLNDGWRDEVGDLVEMLEGMENVKTWSWKRKG